MLPPHLLPSEADLLKCGCIAIVAALTSGMGFLAGARRLETAFFSGWGLACLIFVVAGTWFHLDLAVAAAAMGLLGAIGLARQLVRPGTSGISLRVLLIGAPFVFLVLGMSDIAWDDFFFWVPNLLHLDATNQFPTLASPAVYSAMPGYPYAVALAGFSAHLLGASRIETVAFVWNVLAMLAAGAAFANILARRIRAAGLPPSARALWILATLGVLLEGIANPAFVAKLTLSNMGDSATGAGLAMLSALLFEWNAEAPDAPARSNILREISLTCCAVIFIRQENPALIAILFMSAAAGLLLFQNRSRTRAITNLSATLILPLFVWYSWVRYQVTDIPHGSHFVLPWQQWHWSLFGATLASAFHEMTGKTGYVAMAVAVGYLAARAILGRIRNAERSSGQIDQASRIAITAIAGLAFGNIAFLLFCYLATSFNPVETVAAISFWRFTAQTGQALMIGLACFVPIRWLAFEFRGASLLRILPVIAFVLPIAVFPRLRDDLVSPVPRLQMIAETLHQTPDSKPMVLLDLSGNGFAALVVKYQMTVIEADRRPISVIAEPHGIPPEQVRALSLPSDAYVWLAEGSPTFGKTFGSDTVAGCSYLFARDAGSFQLVRDWDVAPYRQTRGHDQTSMIRDCGR
jgi:hypothetical protein